MPMKTTAKLLIALLLLSSLGISACKLLQGTAFEAQGIPSDFDGLVMWLRADRGAYKDWDCSDEAFEGDPVTCWQDYSDNGNDAKSMGGTPPSFTESAGDINGMAAVQFSGLEPPYDAYLEILNQLPLYGTKIVVGEAFMDQGAFLFEIATTCSIYPLSGFVASIYSTPTGSLFSASSAGIVVLNYDGNSIYSYVNGRLATPNTASNPNGLGTYWIGKDQTSYLNGKIAEIIVFNRVLKDIERMQIEKYLSDKYDIGVSK